MAAERNGREPIDSGLLFLNSPVSDRFSRRYPFWLVALAVVIGFSGPTSAVAETQRNNAQLEAGPSFNPPLKQYCGGDAIVGFGSRGADDYDLTMYPSGWVILIKFVDGNPKGKESWWRPPVLGSRVIRALCEMASVEGFFHMVSSVASNRATPNGDPLRPRTLSAGLKAPAYTYIRIGNECHSNIAITSQCYAVGFSGSSSSEFQRYFVMFNTLLNAAQFPPRDL